mmetsp:Transcript_171/g.538  ORF Transcript_171/g.538 Transcript_171/m.538 type:complete len:361 (-) Transcript_171:151-1233(-)|eukprot:CAMPEP_0198731106 /NCGR_PEP_ID=MMETSP1475-20131203/28137_1 /TAXON_ID= ORGANISM="Unidentified sp., Strain CCMP1999" /NCGR_SAMPLE_ID=MMETSP1475 /ASSEMBLY_ACC=CAM_ASM_001111 /LENGTH=360 /DNA_ID=CAMNT_0044494019 /DNA_START=108 /DNA_END=1190 /DNA_ORIENTATION=-
MTADRGFVARFGASLRGTLTTKLDASVESDPRHPNAHVKGGLTDDPAVIAQQRKVALEIVKQIGTNVLNRKDLLYVTFPAKCSEPRTVLQRVADSVSYSEDFLMDAATTTDPVERLAKVIAFYIGGMHLTSNIRKPLNPILGETYEGQIGKHTRVYVEQASHHPPVTNFLVKGKNFRYHGTMSYSAKFGVNEFKLINKGERVIEFEDGSRIVFNMPMDVFTSVLFGAYRHEMAANIVFEDKKNDVSCNVGFCKTRNMPSDYFHGNIVQKGASVGIVQGSWLGCVDFNGKRLWNINDSLADNYNKTRPSEDVLPTDSRTRTDLQALVAQDMLLAEEQKKFLEEEQRRDRRLRAAGREKPAE